MAENGKLNDEAMLDAFLESATRNPPKPDGAFLARLTDDMMANVPDISKPERSPVRSGTFGSDLFRKFQAIFAASGLTGAAALGVWIGFAMPETLDMLNPEYEAADSFGIGVFLPAADLSVLAE
jgi:hypothetical protein